MKHLTKQVKLAFDCTLWKSCANHVVHAFLINQLLQLALFICGPYSGASVYACEFKLARLHVTVLCLKEERNMHKQNSDSQLYFFIRQRTFLP